MDRTIHKSGFIKKELNLLRPFIREPWRRFTITELKSITKNKSHHYVFNSLKKFCLSGITTEERHGNTNTYSLNSKNNDQIAYLTLVESIIKDERKDIPYSNLLKITKKIKTPYYTFLICGSYAEKKQRPDSDMDVAFIIPNSEKKSQYLAALKEGELMVPEVHGFVFTKDEAYEMLANNEFNYGKEFAKKHILIQGAEMYYKILFEAVEHGFKG
jgi:predicted nucleotidyltransferase